MKDLALAHLKRKLEATNAYLQRPILQHLVVNLLVWSLIMGPLIFLVTNYQPNTGMPWSELPKNMLVFALGGVGYTFFMHLFHAWHKNRLAKKIKKKDQ